MDDVVVRVRTGLGAPLACIAIGGVALLLFSCANPVPPTGGPRDETPPSIAATRPVQDTVNVSTETQTVSITFSEYVERSTMPRALTITPRVGDRVRFDWSGRSVSVELPEALRDSTTYIFTLSTELTDARGVSIKEPIRFAFSTGPRINQGQLQGRVVEPDQAKPRPKVSVFAYPVPEPATRPPRPLPDRPAYRTQTGEDGTFSFEYLRERPYFVLALMDNNRNESPDPSEPFALPPKVSLLADSTAGAIPVPWVLTTADTLAPTVQGAEALSRRRVRVSFDEAVRLGETSEGWILRDSLSGASVPVRSVYRPAEREDAVILRTGRMEPNRHRLRLAPMVVTDTLGNGVRADTLGFTAVARADTTQTRFEAFVPERLSPDSAGAFALLPDVRPGVRFNQALDSALLRRALTLRDTTGRRRSYTSSTTDGRTYVLAPDPALQAGEFVEVVVDGGVLAGPDTTYVQRFRRVTSRALGELEGQVVVVDTGRTAMPSPGTARRTGLGGSSAMPRARDSVTVGTDTVGAGPPGDVDSVNAPRSRFGSRDSVVVELISTKSTIALEPRTLTRPAGSTFVFRELPEGTYRFRAFVDRNGNGRWDGGTVLPYTSAEPITWSNQTVDSRPRWTNVLPSSLRIPILRMRASNRMPSPGDTTAVDSVEGGW